VRLLLFLLFPFGFLTAQTDSLLQSASWEEAGTGYQLLLTPDGTFEQDYGADVKSGRYLMGRYALDSTDQTLLLSVDYFLGKTRIPNRYRRKRDFYIDYRIDRLTADTLVLTDLLTDEVRRFGARPLEDKEDPARRRIPKPKQDQFKLPEGWDGHP
jgi:hypothetical protein